MLQKASRPLWSVLAIAGLLALAVLLVRREPLLLARTDGASRAGNSIVDRLPASVRTPNIVLISLDTLRADRLGCYGYSRPTSPNLDRLAAHSTLFEKVFSTAPATAESHMSMFTALYPPVHEVRTTVENRPIHRLDRNIITLAQVLRKNGYHTAGIHGGGHVSEIYGFGKGFDYYIGGDQSHAEYWLRQNAGKGKFFLFYHTYAVHDPYLPVPPHDTMFTGPYHGRIITDKTRLKREGDGNMGEAFWRRVDRHSPADARRLSDLYDGRIAQLDHDLQSLIDTIQRQAPNTVIIVLSDHGEGFGEDGRFRHGFMRDYILHVPLIIHVPGQAEARRVTSPVSLIELAPAILKIASIPLPAQFRHYFPGEYATLTEPLLFAEFDVASLSTVIAGNNQLVRSGYGDEYRWLGTIPEPRGFIALHAQQAARHRLREALDLFEKRTQLAAAYYNTEKREQRLDPATLERLRSLGYIK